MKTGLRKKTMYSGYRARQFKHKPIAYLNWHYHVLKKSLRYFYDEVRKIRIYKIENKSPTETLVSFDNIIDELKKRLNNG